MANTANHKPPALTSISIDIGKDVFHLEGSWRHRMVMLWFYAAPPDDLQVGETGLHGLIAGCGLSPERICSLHCLASGWTALFDSAGASSLGAPKKKARVRR